MLQYLREQQLLFMLHIPNLDGLKSFNEETILYNTNNFYENCGGKSPVSNTGNNQTSNNFPLEQAIELFEKL